MAKGQHNNVVVRILAAGWTRAIGVQPCHIFTKEWLETMLADDLVMQLEANDPRIPFLVIGVQLV